MTSIAGAAMTSVIDIHIAADHPAFAGHFPGAPIVPGVVLLDQALLAIATARAVSVEHCVLTSVKFRSVVRPGEPLALHCAELHPGTLRFTIESAGRLVTEGTLSLTATREVDP